DPVGAAVAVEPAVLVFTVGAVLPTVSVVRRFPDLPRNGEGRPVDIGHPDAQVTVDVVAGRGINGVVVVSGLPQQERGARGDAGDRGGPDTSDALVPGVHPGGARVVAVPSIPDLPGVPGARLVRVRHPRRAVPPRLGRVGQARAGTIADLVGDPRLQTADLHRPLGHRHGGEVRGHQPCALLLLVRPA